MHNQTQSSRALGWDTNDYVSNTYRGCANLSSTTFTHTGRSGRRFPLVFSFHLVLVFFLASAARLRCSPPPLALQSTFALHRLHRHGGLCRPSASADHHSADQPRVPQSLRRIRGAHSPREAALQQPGRVPCRPRQGAAAVAPATTILMNLSEYTMALQGITIRSHLKAKKEPVVVLSD